MYQVLIIQCLEVESSTAHSLDCNSNFVKNNLNEQKILYIIRY